MIGEPKRSSSERLRAWWNRNVVAISTFLSEKAGATIIHCPYHVEKTPSCAVYPDRFICFGCGAEGYRDELDAMLVKAGRSVPV